MSTYYTIITNNGKEQFATAAQSSSKVNITHLALGDGNGSAPTPSATRTALVKETVRVSVNKVEIHATNRNWIEIHAIIPSESGGYTVRELALYAGTTMIANGSFPAAYKPAATEGGAREMSIKVIIAVDNASVVNVTLDNSLVYATQKWVEDNFVNHNEVINTLTATDTNKPLSAAQGKALHDNKLDKTANAVSASKLATDCTINGVAFDGTQNITIYDNTKLASNGNAASASKLATARTISLTGAVTGSVRFDGSENVSMVTSDDNSIGLIAYFATNSAPTGWLKANGAAVSCTTYAKLFAKIGTTFGAGDGSTTFNLPDLRGEFIRGFDDGRGVDSGRAFGLWQKATLQVSESNDLSSVHGIGLQATANTYKNTVEMAGGDALNDLSLYSGVIQKSVDGAYNEKMINTFSPKGHYTFGTRPRNIALLACIKY